MRYKNKPLNPIKLDKKGFSTEPKTLSKLEQISLKQRAVPAPLQISHRVGQQDGQNKRHVFRMKVSLSPVQVRSRTQLWEEPPVCLHQVGPMPVDDGTEGESVSERGGQVLYLHTGVTGACPAAPVSQSRPRRCHFPCASWVNTALLKQIIRDRTKVPQAAP